MGEVRPPRAPEARLLDVPSAVGLAASVLVAGRLATDRVGEALEWRLYLLLGTVAPALVVAGALATRRWPERVAWTWAAHAFLTVAGLAAAAWSVQVAFDPRAALMAALATFASWLGARGRVAPGPVDWRRDFLDPVLYYAFLLAACHGFLRLLWWPSAPTPTADALGLLQTGWLAALTAGLLAFFAARGGEAPRAARFVAALGVVVLLAASLRIPDFDWDRTWHHWGAFVSPAEMVRDGGTLLWDVPFQYGFLSTLAIAGFPGVNAWEAMRLLDAAALFVSAALLLAAWVGARPDPFAVLVGLCLTLAAVFLLPGDAEPLYGPFILPSMGSFRFVWVYVLLAVVVWESRVAGGAPGRAAWVVGSLVFLVACAWSIESAAYGTATWLPALAWSRYHRARRAAGPRAALGAAAFALALPVGLVGAALLALRAWYRSVLHIEPDLAAFTEYATSFVQIYAALPIEPSGPLAAVVALFSTLCALMYRAFVRPDRLDLQVVALGAFGATWSTTSYFVSSSRAETATSVMPIWLAAFAAWWWANRRAGDPWALPMARPLLAAWAATLLFGVTYDPGRLEPFGRSLVTDPLAPVTPALSRVDRSLHALMTEAGVDPDDRIVLIYPNIMECYDPTPRVREPGEAHVPARVWLPLPVLLRPLPEERRLVYIARIHARGIDRGWYIRPADRPFLGRAYLWKYHLAVEERYEVVRSYSNDDWVIEWREPKAADPTEGSP